MHCSNDASSTASSSVGYWPEKRRGAQPVIAVIVRGLLLGGSRLMTPRCVATQLHRASKPASLHHHQGGPVNQVSAAGGSVVLSVCCDLAEGRWFRYVLGSKRLEGPGFFGRVTDLDAAGRLLVT